VSWGGSYGNAIIIDHGGGKRAIYAHLSKINVKVGQKIIEGQLIGLSGNTGNSSGPHLHFEVRVSPWRYANKDVNPDVLIAGEVKTSLKAKVTANKQDNRVAPEPSKVYPGSPVEPGDKGDAVRALQIAFELEPTGTYDVVLKRKVIAFQKRNPKLGAADGVVGPKTWKVVVK
jgi:murein DD-endopeptidase MepM/ murein hydrolase activator NlpD